MQFPSQDKALCDEVPEYDRSRLYWGQKSDGGKTSSSLGKAKVCQICLRSKRKRLGELLWCTNKKNSALVGFETSRVADIHLDME